MLNFIVGAAMLGLSAMSYKQQRTATKQAKREYETQVAEQSRQADRIIKEKSILEKRAGEARNKLNTSVARGNRRRVKGGLFGDTQVQNNQMTDRLGG